MIFGLGAGVQKSFFCKWICGNILWIFLLSFFKKAGAQARWKSRQPLEKQFIKKTAIQTQLKIFNYYKASNLISEPPRICRAVRRLDGENWRIMGMAGAYAWEKSAPALIYGKSFFDIPRASAKMDAPRFVS